MKTHTFVLVGIGALLGVLLIALVSTQAARPPEFQGSLITPAVPAKNFLLFNQNEQPFQLSDQRGKVVLLFFGYTFCPDVCPTTLFAFRQIHERLSDRAGEVVFVFVTVDPDRDTPAQLKNHLALFSPDFVGLTGEPAQLEMVWTDYFVEPKKQPGAGAAGYLVDHTGRVYVIDRLGDLRLTFPFGLSVEAMFQDVMTLLKEK